MSGSPVLKVGDDETIYGVFFQGKRSNPDIDLLETGYFLRLTAQQAHDIKTRAKIIGQSAPPPPEFQFHDDQIRNELPLVAAYLLPVVVVLGICASVCVSFVFGGICGAVMSFAISSVFAAEKKWREDGDPAHDI